ncbi:MAG: carbamoyltransferase HypF, partial [Gemmatimonadetes bacterium]|nr:carbamoyltransferase HypF [Gemmatimonadota bacterium]
MQARRVHVTGVVQGVGFRPFVHRLAVRFGLAGTARNESGEVFIEVEGTGDALAGFLEALRAEAPVLARIDTLEAEVVAPRGVNGFRVLESRATEGRLPVSPDVATCEACLRELFDPANRRYRYPFITCTDCGPRYTVIESMPYDRVRTSMRAFPQCPTCRREYTDPADRRFHSETNSCPDCGPRIWLAGPDGVPIESGPEAIEAAARMLVRGSVVAIRGLGGYHLACDATSEAAVRQLRAQKVREDKPLAIMVLKLVEARELCHVGRVEERVLSGSERPVVLLRAREESGLAPSVSPGLDTVGVMLAYTPLHLLLLERVGRPLVMTSGNLSELPICTSNEEAGRKLFEVASGFLMHDRDIVSRYDDSVVRVMAGAPVFLRRARGYAPLPVPLPVASPEPLLAVGPHLKNTFSLVAGDSAFVSQHVGDLENVETLDHYREALLRFKTLFRIEPSVVARDLHPGYLSSRIADELGLARMIDVQHHHAHVAAVAGEHGVVDPVIGISYDGTGYGDDGNTWGAEILLADLRSYRRLAHLRYAPMPGGDLAARRPWRVAAGYAALDAACEKAFANAFYGVTKQEKRLADAQIERRVNAPLASSMGRLFDAAAAILGVRRVASYEGQAAMELEALASRYVLGLGSGEGDPGDMIASESTRARLPDIGFPVRVREEGTLEMDPLPLLADLGARSAGGADKGLLAAAFHLAVGRTTVDVAAGACRELSIGTVALGGGVFQNGLLLAIVKEGLEERGLNVLLPQRLGPNDGGISYGQAVVAA